MVITSNNYISVIPDNKWKLKEKFDYNYLEEFDSNHNSYNEDSPPIKKRKSLY